MDARGWISISLLASFNRVRRLTLDVHFVRDVLTLSSLVEVRGNMVRMAGDAWERFVLPGARPSYVEEQPLPVWYRHLTDEFGEGGNPHHQYPHGSVEAGVDADADGGPAEYFGTPAQNYSASEEESEHDYDHDTKQPGSALLVNGNGQPVNEEDDEDEEDEVEIVMGEETGTFMGERRSS